MIGPKLKKLHILKDFELTVLCDVVLWYCWGCGGGFFFFVKSMWGLMYCAMPPLLFILAVDIVSGEGERWAGGGEGELLGVNSNPAWSWDKYWARSMSCWCSGWWWWLFWDIVVEFLARLAAAAATVAKVISANWFKGLLGLKSIFLLLLVVVTVVVAPSAEGFRRMGSVTKIQWNLFNVYKILCVLCVCEHASFFLVL